MLSLSSVRNELGIDPSDDTYDADLKRFIRQVVARIRQRTNRYICWQTDQIVQEGNNLVLRCVGHQLKTGEIIRVVGSDTVPSVDADYTITVRDRDTIVIPYSAGDLSDDGTYATLHPKWVAEFPATDHRMLWVPQRYLPLLIVDRIEVRDALDEWTVLDPSDYRLTSDDDTAKALAIERLSGVWPVDYTVPRYQYRLARRSGLNNIRMVFYAGTATVPDEIVMAGESLVCDLWERQGGGKDVASVSFEGVSATRLQGTERESHVHSPDNVLVTWAAR